MPVLINHGGMCCGVRHLHSFGSGMISPWASEEQKIAHRNKNSPDVIRAHVAHFGPPGNATRRNKGKCVEAVVTDSQFRAMPELAQTLADEGFRIVTRFHNSSGGMCNVLHRVSGSRDIKRAAVRNPHLRVLMGK